MQMKETSGYMGKLCHVDLTKMRTEIMPSDRKNAKAYLGGRGLGEKIVSDLVDPELNPFDPRNALVIMAGPITGTRAPCSGRHSVASKSPLSGTIADSSSGGFFGMMLKRAGFDGVVVVGKAREPVYVLLSNGDVELRDASHLWGKTTEEIEPLLRKDVDKKARIACIGPAGENLVRFASVMNDVHRAAGRCGMGAVMGSKKLKAVAVIGDKEIEYYDSEKVEEILEEIRNRQLTSKDADVKISSYLENFSKYGTAIGINPANEMGMLPTKYHETDHFKKADEISGEILAEKHLIKNKTCFNCPIACWHVSKARWHGEEVITEGPEFETIISLGSICDNSDMNSIIVANHLCNIYGMDTISTGQVIGFALGASEKGYLDTGLKFGDGEAVVELVEKIAHRQGIGDLLAEGVARASKKIGAEDYAVHIKGMEPPAFDPRVLVGQGLAFMVASRGCDHRRGSIVMTEGFGIPFPMNNYSTKGKPTLVAITENTSAVSDSAVICAFGMFLYFEVKRPRIPASLVVNMMEWLPRVAMRGSSFDLLRDAINAVTGFNYSNFDLMEIGERIISTERAFNVKAGFRRKDDYLAKRWLKESVKSGPTAGAIFKEEDQEKMLDKYYKIRRWDKDGVPKEKTLKKLGIKR